MTIFAGRLAWESVGFRWIFEKFESLKTRQKNHRPELQIHCAGSTTVELEETERSAEFMFDFIDFYELYNHNLCHHYRLIGL